MSSDTAYMGHALRLAARGLGNVWPNPAVGCVIVASGRVIGRGWTQPGGRPHAETEALDQALERFGAPALRGATAYVSLEPCSHQGQTGPCADALAAAAVGRVVIGCGDPDPRVAGQGVAKLQAAGIDVTNDVLGGAAREMNAGFIQRVTAGRPLVTLKGASTLDGRIATRTGVSQWITGEAARRRTHVMRAQYDAIMTGIGTVLQDDPQLTCRLAGLEARSPVRVVLDSNLQLPLDAALAKSAGSVPTWVIAGEGAEAQRTRALEKAGVEVVTVAREASGRVDPAAALAKLGERGITRVMVEGGAALSASLLREGLVDRLALFRAPRAMGGDGLPLFDTLEVAEIGEMPAFEPLSREEFGDETLDIYRRLP